MSSFLCIQWSLEHKELCSHTNQSIDLSSYFAIDGFLKTSTTHASNPITIGTSTIAPVRLTISPPLVNRLSPKTTTAAFSGSNLRAITFKPLENLPHLLGLDILQTIDARNHHQWLRLIQFLRDLV